MDGNLKNSNIRYKIWQGLLWPCIALSCLAFLLIIIRSLNIGLNPLIPLSIIAVLLAVMVKNSRLKYFNCPYCDKSMKIKDRWVCDHCHQIQPKEKNITSPCRYCKRELKTIFCEHCHQEMKL